MAKYYIMGIAGTAMTALAILLKQKGHEITGSDSGIYPPMSETLSNAKIPVLQPFQEQNIADKNDHIIIIGNAISRGNPELEYILDRKWAYNSMAETLRREFLWGTKNIVVTGTHGKTTTSAMLTKVFNHSPLSGGSSFFIGGQPLDFEFPAFYSPHSSFFILEGDEYDTAYFDKRSKFIHYLPDTVIINNIEFDHADIFNNLAEIQKSFYHLVRIIPRNGLLIYNGDDANIPDALRQVCCPTLTFGKSTQCDLRIDFEGIDSKGLTRGNFHFRNETLPVTLSLLGEHQLYNAAAVFLASQYYGLDTHHILQALFEFQGTRRRLTKIYEHGNQLIFEDFGHHPTAIEKTLAALRLRYPEHSIIHCQELSNNTSYRKTHQLEYEHCFNHASTVFFKVHPRFYKMDAPDRLDFNQLTMALITKQVEFATFSDTESLWQRLLTTILPEKKQLFVIAGTGSFDGLTQKLKSYFEKMKGIYYEQ